MLDPTKTNIPARRAECIKAGRTRPEALDEFHHALEKIAGDFHAQLQTQDSDTVLAYFAAARNCLRRHRQPRWWFLLTGSLAAREWLRRRGYSPTWSEWQMEDVFAVLEGDDRDWCEDWRKNQIQ